MAGKSLLPPALVGNIFAMTQEVVFLNQKCQFGFYWQQVLAQAVTKVAEGYNAIQLNWLNNVLPLLRPCLSAGTLIGDLRIWCMTWPDQATGIFSMGLAHGSVAGDPLPPQIALVLTKLTGLRGSSGRGRMYLCGLSEDSSTNGAPINALLTPVGLLCANLKAPWIDVATGVTYNPVVVSLKQYGIDRLDPPIPPAAVGLPKPPPIATRGGIITSMFSPLIFNTQRRRTIGRGQ